MAVDLFANAANTTLTAALTAGATSLTVTSSTLFPAVTTAAGTQFRVIIDSELFIVTNVTGLSWTVTPGAEGTTQAAHANGATVTAVVTAGALGSKGVNITVGSGQYLSPPTIGTATSSSQGINNLRAMPLDLPVSMTVNAIGVNVITGVATALCRVGIYSDVAGLPSALIVDAGTVDCSTAGWKDATISQVLAAGRYWLTACTQVAASTLKDMAASSGPINMASTTGQSGYYNSAGGITGAFPANFGASTANVSAGLIHMHLKVA